jgi:surface protein
MGGMFRSCTRLTTIGNVGNWNTGKVYSMFEMFRKCHSLTSLDVSNWDVSNVSFMESMFNYCSNLPNIDMSGWDTSKVENMHYMFYHNNMTSIDLSNLKFNSITGIINMMMCETDNTTLKILALPKEDLPSEIPEFIKNRNGLKVVKCDNKNNIQAIIKYLPVRTEADPGKIITKVPMSQFTELEIQALADKNWAISNETLQVVA